MLLVSSDQRDQLTERTIDYRINLKLRNSAVAVMLISIDNKDQLTELPVMLISCARAVNLQRHEGSNYRAHS